MTPRTARGRVRSTPVPSRRSRQRSRLLRRLVLSLFVVVCAALVGWLYMLHVYAPGLRAEARSIPARVRAQLATHNAPYVPISRISPDLQHALVAIEDRRFYSHPGVDPLGMVRALWVNLTQHNVDQGGSTLEEQLVKRAIVLDDRSIHAKLREVALAWATDQDFSKSKVIELYLNAAYFGQGAYGASEAARTYFGTDVAHLTIPQAAFLAALPQAPSVYGANPTSPVIHARWLTVLQDMQQLNYITPRQERRAATTTLRFSLPNP